MKKTDNLISALLLVVFLLFLYYLVVGDSRLALLSYWSGFVILLFGYIFSMNNQEWVDGLVEETKHLPIPDDSIVYISIGIASLLWPVYLATKISST